MYVRILGLDLGCARRGEEKKVLTSKASASEISLRTCCHPVERLAARWFVSVFFVYLRACPCTCACTSAVRYLEFEGKKKKKKRKKEKVRSKFSLASSLNDIDMTWWQLAGS